MKRRFVTLFPECPNYGLVKDVGMIPYTLGQYYDYDARLASAEIDYNGIYIHDEVKGINIDKLSKGSAFIVGIKYLVKNAKRIDVLNLYHIRYRNIFWVMTYKFLNKTGKVFLKTDMDYITLEYLKHNRHALRWFFVFLSEQCDLISAESEKFVKYLKSLTDTKVVLIQNGYLKGDFDSVEKENIIISVGRLGTKQKATDVLMESFLQTMEKHTYNLVLVGSVEESFKDDMRKYMDDAKGRIVYLGEIKNKKDLLAVYQKAKIFILTSRWEGFPLVIPEAISCGNYLLLTDAVPPAADIIVNKSVGQIMKTDNIEDISEKINEAISYVENNDTYDEITSMAPQFDWVNIGRTLDKYL